MNPRERVPVSTRCIGSKVTASSWMFTSSTSAYRAGCEARCASLSFGFIPSQHSFAAARLWLPSPIAYFISPSIASSLAVSARAASPVTRLPLMWPPPSIKSKSYSSSPPAAEGMIVFPASFMNTMMCGISSTAPRRTSTRAGSRLSTVPSVARTGVAVPSAQS